MPSNMLLYTHCAFIKYLYLCKIAYMNVNIIFLLYIYYNHNI